MAAIVAIVICTACGGGGGGGNSAPATAPGYSFTELPTSTALTNLSPYQVNFFQPMLQGSDGNFYVITGNLGFALYKITPAGDVTQLYALNNPAVEIMRSFIQGSDGNFYVMTWDGGANDSGAVFKITPGGNGSVIYSFPSPSLGGTLIQGADGNLYGTTLPVTNSFGTVFKLTTSGTFSVLYTAPSSENSINAMTQGADGNLYLATQSLVKMSTAGVMTSLGNASLADSPETLLQGQDGNFYGLAFASSAGTQNFVQISPLGVETVLYTFTGLGACTASLDNTEICTGPMPVTLFQGTDGNFYASTTYNNANSSSSSTGGDIYKLTSTGQATIIYSYGNSQNYAPSLIQGSDGKLYGISSPLPGGNLTNWFSISL